MRILLAFRTFFAVLFSGQTAQRVRGALEAAAEEKPQIEEPKAKPEPDKPKPPQRSEALTLLAALQREARFVDFVKEPLDSYSDAQVGAAARDVHRGCAEVIERMFAPAAASEEEEGATVEVPAGFDPGAYKLVGNVQGEPPFHGKLTHHGWQAAKCDLPQWSGGEGSTRIIAPVEVELK